MYRVLWSGKAMRCQPLGSRDGAVAGLCMPAMYAVATQTAFTEVYAYIAVRSCAYRLSKERASAAYQCPSTVPDSPTKSRRQQH